MYVVFLKKEKNLCIVLYICCYSFISNFIYIQALKKIVYSFAIIRKKKTFVQNILRSKYSVVFRKPLVKKYVNDNKSKLLFRFTITKMDWGRCMLCQKDSSPPLLKYCSLWICQSQKQYRRISKKWSSISFWNPCTLKRITRRWWNYSKFKERKSKTAWKLRIRTFSF